MLAARLVVRRALRYTPAGLPALDFELKHESQPTEDGQPRKVVMQLRAVAIGRIAEPLTALELGSEGQFGGLQAAARTGRGLLYHVTVFAPASP